MSDPGDTSTQAAKKGAPVKVSAQLQAALAPIAMIVSDPVPAAPKFTATVAVDVAAVLTPELDGGFSAEVPALPGCFTQGETLEETLANVREAAEAWLQSADAHSAGAAR